METGMMYCHQEHRQLRVDKQGRKVEYYSPPPHAVRARAQNHPRCPVCGGPLCREPHQMRLIKKIKY